MDILNEEGLKILLDLDISFTFTKQRYGNKKNKIRAVDTLYIYRYRASYYDHISDIVRYAIAKDKVNMPTVSVLTVDKIWYWLKNSNIKTLETGKGKNRIIFKLDYETTQ